MSNRTIHISNDLSFSESQSIALAKLIYARFGNNIASAANGWRRLLENNCSDYAFQKLVLSNDDEEKYSKYIKGGGNHCLSCGSDEIEGDSVNIDSNTAAQEISCNECGSTWKDIYELSSVVDVEIN